MYCPPPEKQIFLWWIQQSALDLPGKFEFVCQVLQKVFNLLLTLQDANVWQQRCGLYRLLVTHIRHWAVAVSVLRAHSQHRDQGLSCQKQLLVPTIENVTANHSGQMLVNPSHLPECPEPFKGLKGICAWTMDIAHVLNHFRTGARWYMSALWMKYSFYGSS